ncbi:MAG TPA: flagellar hook-basal body protein [Symbiobacteriaceae bacterium]|nr:flagellar hook-basal body protein [Symbiobacteriaceae bacterium]
MLRGIYTSASGMLADQRRLDVVANNLANAGTTGFKRETTVSKSFTDFLIQRVNDDDPIARALPSNIGRLGIGTYVVNTATRLTTGSLQPTGNPLDVAIAGDGFFAVNTPQGLRYTRQGSFRQSGDGTLVTPDGYEVLVDGHSVRAEDGSLSITGDGDIMASEQNLGRLSVVTSRDLGALRKEGNGLWTVPGGAGDFTTLVSPAETSGSFQLKVGYLEASNVESVTEMVEMMTTMRSFEANQKALQAQDETLQKAVTEIGRI